LWRQTCSQHCGQDYIIEKERAMNARTRPTAQAAADVNKQKLIHDFKVVVLRKYSCRTDFG